MTKHRFLSISLLLLLFALMLTLPVGAQGPTELTDLTIKLWPEYDSPELLVIIDGHLATPDSEVRIPIPAEARLNAVATGDGSGRLLKNDFSEEKADDGSRILVMTPQQPLFRVEYYTPFPVDGDKRNITFELPAGYLNASQVTIEALLPPDSQNIKLTPPTDESGPTQDEAHIFRRNLADVTNEAISQQVVYDNPSGALTVPDSPTTDSAPTPSGTSDSQQPAAEKAAKSSLNPWLIVLGVAALLLIVGGAVGLWLTRDREDIPEDGPAMSSGKRKRKASTPLKRTSEAHLDRYCRQCGNEFSQGDKFCRQCGAPRQRI